MNKRSVSIKLIALLIAGYITINAGVVGFCNSAPLISEEFPGSEIVVDEDTPISVEAENLKFEIGSMAYGIGATVQASYDMLNQSTEDQNIKMVFPLVSSISAMKQMTTISVDGKLIPYHAEYKMSVNNPDKLPDFQSILGWKSALNAYENIPEEVKTYTLKYDPTLEDVRAELKFNLTDETAMIICDDINSYGFDSGKYIVGSWIGRQAVSEKTGASNDSDMTFSLTKGEISNLEIELIDDQQNIVAGNVKLEESFRSKETLIDRIRAKFADQAFTAEEANLFAMNALNELIETSDFRFVPLDELSNYLYSQRVILLEYEVPFEVGENRHVEVVYNMQGSMDRSKSSTPQYTFDYFLSPASHWKTFNNLTLDIETTENLPYILEASVEVERIDEAPNDLTDGGFHYRGFYETLPEGELKFTVYEKEKVTIMDKTLGTWSRKYSYPFFLIVLPCLSLVIAVFFIVKIVGFLQKRI